MVSRDIKSLDEIPLKFIEIMDDLMLEIADLFLATADKNLKEGNWQNAKGEGAFNTGELANSGRIESNPFEKTVIYDAPHASIIEFGTRPHMPPVDPLIRWAKLKFQVDDTEASKIGWAIAKTIKKFGTYPRPFFRQALIEVLSESVINRIIRSYLQKVL